MTVLETNSSTLAPRPFVRIALVFMAGIVYAHSFPLGLTFSISLILLLTLVWSLSWQRYPILRHRRAIWVMVLGAAFFSGAMRMEIETQWRLRVDHQVLNMSRFGDQAMRGDVEEMRPLPFGNASLILNNVWMEKWNHERRFIGRVEVRASWSRAETLRPGDRIALRGEVAPLRGPHVPTGMSWRDYRYAQGVYATIYADENSPLQVIHPAHWSVTRGLAHKTLERMSDAFPDLRPLQRVEDGREAALGLIAAMAFGLRGWTPPELVESLQLSGLAHITSISGLHVTFALLGIAKALRLLGLRRRSAGAITLVFSLFYILLVGIRIPTLRAVMMAWALIGGDFLQRRADSLNSMGLAALVLLMLSPGELFLPSFQLSFAATLFLLIYLPSNDFLKHWPGPLRVGIFGLLGSMAVTLGIAPFTIVYFHHIAWGAIPGNLFAVPLAVFLLFFTYVWALALFLGLGVLANPLGQAVGWLSTSLLHVIDTIAALEPLQWTMPFPGTIPLTLSFAALIALARPMQTLYRWGEFQFRGAHAGLLFLALAASGLLNAPLFPRFEAHFIALGQGDCILLRVPSGETILVDGGPQPRTLTQRRLTLLEDYLLSLGLRRIHLMALTHPDSDHIGAMPQVVRRFAVDQVIESVSRNGHAHYDDFEEALKNGNVLRHIARCGDWIRAGTLEGWVLHPRDEDSLLEFNEASLVIHWRYRDFDILLTGDIGQRTERQLAERGLLREVDLLKAAHHGSRFSTSRTFLRVTQPTFAVIQSGRNNHGHPHPDAIGRLLENGAHILRNDEDGSVRLSIDRRGVRLYTSRSNRLYVLRNIH